MRIYNQKLKADLFSQAPAFFAQFGRGIERETLRITHEAKLSPLAHPTLLGSALTNPHITTDYAETLLEFITPVESDVEKSIQQLTDIQKFTYQHINNELLWPMSMPCFVGQESDIKIAQYGSSNIGKMKSVYREGLRHRYGSMMQVISGVHFNFSFPDSFWPLWAKHQDNIAIKDPASVGYLSVIRNLKRHLWLLPYLFGASPALCSSFLKGQEHKLPFEKIGKGTLYLPYATSLRLSDLGYTNKAQSNLDIRYNCLFNYIEGLRHAIHLPSNDFAHIGVKENGVYKQLNTNVLQIENEFYSSIRPKRVTESGESPTDALERKGIQYIEVRALDVDPYSSVGINADQIRFIDLLLIYCALGTTDYIQPAEQAVYDDNFKHVILRGREPGLTLIRDGAPCELKTWATDVLTELAEIACVIDAKNDNTAYQDALATQQLKVDDAAQTPSGKIIDYLLKNKMDNGALGMQLAREYQVEAQQVPYRLYSDAFFTHNAIESWDAQKAIEAADTLSFDDFLADYFSHNESVEPA
ncbi:glutamate--cysteine ligase [Algibacillus agarilyticus]|uniref:glutamate--cysteine ligase n=1 Tax=Algibacillus agarilyticus TaxID=2234133 RepID=UPI001E55E22F|nr:glutamate--cysteine ligase [Algibacillus agarilyticus]